MTDSSAPPHPAPLLLSLPYHKDSTGYFHTINTALPMAVILQSDTPAPAMRGRFDIISAAPLGWLETSNTGVHWQGSPVWPTDCSVNQDNSFAALSQYLEQMTADDVDYRACAAAGLPFCGGFIGYCSYDLAREYIALPEQPAPDIDLPLMQFGFYAWACIQDHRLQKSWLVIHPRCDSTLTAQLSDLLAKPTAGMAAGTTNQNQKTVFAADTTRQHYANDFAKIRQYILAGDCYQINYAQRFTAHCAVNATALYQTLRKAMPSPFSALLPVLGRKTNILSFSPERFLQMDSNGQVQTQPIKGTAARHHEPQHDREAAQRLLQDEKNRAENVMIVDLLRNDLGKVCETGSVLVTKLCELHSFANVHHLVSTVQGQLDKKYNAADLFAACFPGGSITGAPKIRAMEIIAELEPSRRSIYCGSIACFSAHGTMDSNIAIRTLLLHNNRLYCWGGGGIVADSVVEDEYRESLAKVQILLDAATKVE